MNARNLQLRARIKLKNPLTYLSLPNTPLNISSMEGELTTVKMLIENGAEVQNDALWIAAACGHADIVEYLILNGADVNRESDIDKLNPKPLQIALHKERNNHCIFLLLNYGASYHSILRNQRLRQGPPLPSLSSLKSFVIIKNIMKMYHSNLIETRQLLISAISNDCEMVSRCLYYIFDTHRDAIMLQQQDDKTKQLSRFLRFFLNHLYCLGQTQPEWLDMMEISRYFSGFSLHLNAYDATNAINNPSALFSSTKQKLQTLNYIERGTSLENTKSFFRDKC